MQKSLSIDTSIETHQLILAHRRRELKIIEHWLEALRLLLLVIASRPIRSSSSDRSSSVDLILVSKVTSANFKALVLSRRLHGRYLLHVVLICSHEFFLRPLSSQIRGTCWGS